MYRIQTLNKIAAVGLRELDGNDFTIANEVQDPDGILVRSQDLHDTEFGPSLRAIARAGAGTNNIPVDECAEKGIVVFNTPGANANAVKELVLCALLLCSRHVIAGVKWVEGLDLKTTDVSKAIEKGKSQFVGPEIAGKNLAVIGLGAVGVKVANAALQLGMNVYGYDPYLSVSNALVLNPAVQLTDLKTAAEKADYITIHSPLLPSTKDMVDAQLISTMKPGVRIVNLARGGLVNDEAIIAALEQGQVACYVTDFPDNNLVGKTNVICFPHLGASTPESEDNCAVLAAQELRDYLLNGNIRNSVNFPNVEMPRSGRARLGIIHRNQPKMLSSFTALLSENDVNIINLTNKSKGDYAYTLIDLNQEIDEDILDRVRALDGVLRLRIIH